MFMLIMVNVYTILIVSMGQALNVYGDSCECLYMIGRVGWAMNVCVDSGECLYHPDWQGGR